MLMLRSLHLSVLMLCALLAGAQMQSDVPNVELADLPILQELKPARGVYHSFEDLTRNRLDTSIRFDLKREKYYGMASSVKVKFENLTQQTEPYGLRVDTTIFVGSGGRYISLIKSENGFDTYLPRPAQFDRSAIIISATIMGGLLGGTIAALLTEEDAYNGIPVMYKLDMQTGEWSLKENLSLKQITAEKELTKATSRLEERRDLCKHIIHYSRYSKGEDEVCMTWAKGELGCLRKSEYSILLIAPRPEIIKVDVALELDTIITIALDLSKARTFIHSISIDKRNNLSVRTLPNEMRNDYLRKIHPMDEQYAFLDMKINEPPPIVERPKTQQQLRREQRREHQGFVGAPRSRVFQNRSKPNKGRNIFVISAGDTLGCVAPGKHMIWLVPASWEQESVTFSTTEARIEAAQVSVDLKDEDPDLFYIDSDGRSALKARKVDDHLKRELLRLLLPMDRTKTCN